jgi:feruloyl esterase
MMPIIVLSHGRSVQSLLAAGAATLALTAATSAHAASLCGDMLQAKLPNMTVNAASDVAGLLPENKLAPSLKPGAAGLKDLPRFCRVIATLTPAANSHIRFEIWLPEQWNGKLLGIGNHGFGGEFEHEDMAMGLRRGYAVAMSDEGVGSAGPAVTGGSGYSVGNAKQVGDNPAAATDFAWRATHEMTVVAKAMVQMSYGMAARRSYFDACSNGGRQSIREAQQFPDDYDGIIAGSAGLNWTKFMASQLWQYQALSGAGMTQVKLDLAQHAAIAACDRLDGVADGVIADPRQCHWKPSAIQCKPGADPSTCLTAQEAAAIARVEGSMTDPKTGKVIYGGWYPGGESLWGTLGNMATLVATANVHFRDVVARDPKWTAAGADMIKLLAESERKGAPSVEINTTNPDLSAFRKRGGKLIEYHGWNDQAMPATFHPKFYAEVVDLQPGKDKLARAQDFYRLFMVPGMAHCRGGVGPVNFGALTNPPSPTVDADHDILEALDRWVDKKVAPGSIVATEFDAKGAPKRQMPLCPYPGAAIYTSGDVNSASSFVCKAPLKRIASALK